MNTPHCQVPATLMEPGPAAAHVAQGGQRVHARPPGGGRSEPDAPSPPARPLLGGCATSGGEARAERGSGHTGRPLCPARAPIGAPRGRGSVRRARRTRPEACVGNNRLRTARSGRHVPRPRRARRGPPRRRNMAAGPPLLPSPPSPPAPRSPASAPSQLHAVAGASRDLAGVGDTGGANGAPPRTRESCPRGGTQKPTRSARVAPEPRGPRGPAPARARTKFRGLPPTPLARPPARRFLVGAPPPGPRPAPCAAAALFCRRFNSRPREKLCPHGRRAPRPGPAAPGSGRRPRAHPPQSHCVRRAGPRRAPGPPPPRAPPARVQTRTAVPGTPAPNGPTPPSLLDPPDRDSSRPRPSRPPPPPCRGAHNRFPFPEPAAGRAGALTGAAATIFASLRATTTARGPRPGVGGAAGPAPGRARGLRGGTRGTVPPHPSASPPGAKWREGAGRAAAAAPRRTMWVNEGRRLPPQRKYGQAPLPH